ncbi:MAG: hypothetical protein LBU23_12785, partial [Planctomycetota bacterium]|nr:hypothetical protein [Planctomycetota bacterium]
ALPWRRHDAQSWVAIWRMPILAGGQAINGWLVDRRRTQAGRRLIMDWDIFGGKWARTCRAEALDAVTGGNEPWKRERP